MIIFIRFNEWVNFYKYNLVPKKISKKQFIDCINCSYRTANLELEIEKSYARRYSNKEDAYKSSVTDGKPNCRKKCCLIDKLKLKRLEESFNLIPQFDKDGLVPIVVQDSQTDKILMLAYANREALELTINTGYATFWSRSRKKLWKKGETSNDLLEILDILIDCDQDALIYKVIPKGGVCHTRNSLNETRKTCFYRRIININLLEYLRELK